MNRMSNDFVAMKIIRLQATDLSTGSPLPWSVYAEDGELLLKKGQTLSSEHQKHILLTRGLYRQASQNEACELEKQAKLSLTSPFNVLDAIRLNVSRILEDMQQTIASDYMQRVYKVATVIQKLCHENTDAVLGAIILDREARYTQIHPVMCSLLTELLLRRNKIPPQDRLHYIAAALTQNIGMLRLQEVLNKQSSPLTDHQHNAIRNHPSISYEILRDLGIDNNEWLETVRNHHERPDGSGYPYGRKGDEISLYARTLSLSDIYSAMVLPRAYRDGYYVKKALRDIFIQRGSGVDAGLAQLLVKELGIYPPGSFVQLANKEIAIVVHRGKKQANQPVVLSIISPHGAPYKNPQRRDTTHQNLYGIAKIIPRINEITLDKNEIWGLGKNTQHR